jgi:serine phosphatase RsbU (regulator of sigma subunit)
LARDASAAIENARLLREAEDKRDMERELTTAREVQAALLPKRFWTGSFFAIDGCSLPSRHLGGDFLDQVQLADGRLGFVVADVAGKGLPASLLAAALQGMLAAECTTEQSLPRMVERVNRALCKLVPEDRFITMLFGALAPDGELCYVNAGHCSPVLATAGGIVSPNEGDVALGFMDGAKFAERRLRMQAGDALAIYTDGITEAVNEQRELFGEQRFERMMQASRGKPPAEIVTTIRRAVTTFCGKVSQSDDITVLVVEYLGER